MASEKYNVTDFDIYWDKEESDVSQDEIAYVSITAVGWTSCASTADAMALVPPTLPVTANGPCGHSTFYTGAELYRKGAKFSDGMIRVEATYRAYVGSLTEGPGGESDETTGEQDKTGLRISTVEEPLLTHPVAMKFPRTQINLLSALISGFVRSNWDVEQETGGSGEKEFVRQNQTTGLWDSEVVFDGTTFSVSVSGKTITASPLEYARLIKAGVTTYKASSQIFTWTGARKFKASSSELNRVGSIVNPSKAPSVSEREWFYEGLMENQATSGIYEFSREYLLSGPGGAFKQLYAGGTGDINDNP